MSDARYCSGMGVNILGFNLDPDSENNISVQDLKMVQEWVEGVEFALEGTNKLSDNGKEFKSLVSYFTMNAEIFKELDLDPKRVILDINCQSYPQTDMPNNIAGLILRFDEGELKSNLEVLEELNKKPELLVFIETPEMNKLVSELTNKWPNLGIALSGGKELRPGFKDFYELAPVLDFLEID